LIQINVASLSAYCVRACKIKHFTEREFSGIFSLARGNLAFSKREFPVALLSTSETSWTSLTHRQLICSEQAGSTLAKYGHLKLIGYTAHQPQVQVQVSKTSEVPNI